MEASVHDEAADHLLEFDQSSVWNTDPSLNIELEDREAPVEQGTSTSSSHQSDAIESLETARFASLKLFSPWFPQADPKHDRARTVKAWWSRRRTVLVTASITATTVCLVNTIGAIVLLKIYPDSHLFEGDCATTSRLNSVIHVIINVLSSLLLGASNLCMQLLSAPTRGEVNKAHARSEWLDIGIPSIKNLRFIAWRRKVVWLILAISSLPLHLFFNSAVINMVPQNTYSWAVVTPSFLTGAPWNYTVMTATHDARANTPVWGLDNSSQLTQHPLGYVGHPPKWFDFGAHDAQRMQYNITHDRPSYNNLSAFDCLKRYTAFERDISDLILVSTYDTLKNSSVFLEDGNSLLVKGDQINTWVWVTPGLAMWECGMSNGFDCFRPKSWSSDENITADWNILGYKVDYCLSRHQYLGDKCSLRLVETIMIVVCVANMAKCLCIFYTLSLHWRKNARNSPLSTLGDAALSFLTEPDVHTVDMSMTDRANVDQMWKNTERTGEPWRPQRDRWYAVSSKWTFISTAMICTCVVVVVIALFIAGMINTASVMGSKLPNIGDLGFGRPSQFEKSIGGGLGIFLGHPMRAFYVSVLWANSWQLVLSILYVQYNAQVTAFLVGVEWSRFAYVPTQDNDTTTDRLEASASSLPFRKRIKRAFVLRNIYHKVERNLNRPKTSVRKTLRVSEPVGLQRSSYFVSMPLRYGIPLIATMSTLHWLISQAIFVVAAVPYASNGLSGVPSYTSAYSLESIIIAICVSSVLIIALIVLGTRRYPGTIPLASSCSAAISAACHPPEGDNEAHLFPVQWGVVSRGKDGVGHCSLSTDRYIEAPVVGELYA